MNSEESESGSQIKRSVSSPIYESQSSVNTFKKIIELKKRQLPAVIFNFLNILLTLVTISAYIFTTYNPGKVKIHSKMFFSVNFSSRIYFLLDYLSDVYLSSDNSFTMMYTMLFELLSTIPYFFSRIVVGMDENLSSNSHMICSALISLRIFRLLVFSKYIKSDVNRELFTIICTMICLLVSASILVNVIENSQTIGRYWLFLPKDCIDHYNCDGVNDSFHNSLFFVMTTIATIGYSSTITSVAGRCIIIGLIVIAVYEIPSLSSDLMVQLSSKSLYARTTYKKLENVEFILISGNISYGSIVVLLQEYFHPDHGENERHALILLPQRPDNNMKSLLQEYQNKLFYLEGDPLKMNDLQRCQFKSANMIMLLCNKQTDDSTAEDSKTIIQAMAIKKFFQQDEEENEESGTSEVLKHINTLRSKSGTLVEKSNTIKPANNNNNEEMVNNQTNTQNNENNNGTLTSIQNGNNNNNNAIKDNNQGSRLIIQLLRPESEHHFALSISNNNNNDQILCIDELKLSLLAKSCLTRGIIALISNLIITNNFEEEIEEQLGNCKWIEEYKHGKDYEIYKIHLDYLKGYKFSFIAEKIYKEKKTILFGLNIQAKDDKMNIVLLSPMDFILPFDQEVTVSGYLLAKDQKDADNVMLWAKSQKRANFEAKMNDNLNQDPQKNKRVNRQLEDEENLLNNELDKENKDIYSTDALTFAKICHVTTEHISKSSVTIDSIEKMLIAKGHIIICGVCQNLIDFIKPLRAKYIPKSEFPTIVILSKELPDDKVWNSIAFFEQIYLVQGDPMKKEDLKRAGIRFAKRVVILAPGITEISQFTMSKRLKNLKNESNDEIENQLLPTSITARKLTREEEDLLDAKTIFKYNLISKLKKDIFCVIELINPKNVSFLNNKMRKNNDEYRFIKIGLNIDATASFASGEVYYSSIMDNLITQAYYNPSLLSVLKKLIVGGDQNALLKNSSLNRYANVPSGNLYLIDMPHTLFVNYEMLDNGCVKFEDIFINLLSKNIIVIGVYRAGDLHSDTKNNNNNNNTNNEPSDYDVNKDAYKSKGYENFYYVVTAPEESFEVSIKDKLFVISPEYPTEDVLINGNKENVESNAPSDDDPMNGLKGHGKKVEDKKEQRREIDEEGEDKIKHLNNDLKETQDLLEEIQKSIDKARNDSEKIITESIKKKITNLYNKK